MVSPNDLVFKYKQRTLLDVLNPKVVQNSKSDFVSSSKEYQCVIQSQPRKDSVVEYRMNEDVMYKNPFKSHVKWFCAKYLKRISP